MKIHLIFYTDANFELRGKYLLNKLQNIGFDKIINYRKEWLETTDFYLDNKEILNMLRGGGYWLWKPYIIIEAMKNFEYGDVVFYVDAGDDISNNIFSIIKDHMINHDYIITNWGGRRAPNKYYTKKDCFVLMECDEKKYHDVPQIEAGTLIFKKN